MKKLLLLSLLTLLLGGTANAQWTTLASDGSGDGSNASLLDGAKLEYRYDDMTDSVWFRVTVNNYKAYGYGINIVLNVTGAGATGTWWGNQNSSFQYNRLITAWISTPPMGTVGITDPAGAAASNYTKIAGASKISIVGDPSGKTYTLGMKRTDIYNSTSLTANVIAAVGSNMSWNDDLPNTNYGTMTLTPNTTSVTTISNTQQFAICPNPSNGVFTIERKVESEADIAVYNVAGVKVFTSSTGNKQVNLDLSHLNAGMYFVQLTDERSTTTRTITIQ